MESLRDPTGGYETVNGDFALKFEKDEGGTGYLRFDNQ